jgi:tripartite-type tricarboxylate transporter receptor subunit TctC
LIRYIEYIRTGKLRALATTGAQRSELLPNVPTVNEIVQIIEILNREINAAFDDPVIRARFAEWGATPLPGSPADFGKFFMREIEKWGQVVKYSGARAD